MFTQKILIQLPRIHSVLSKFHQIQIIRIDFYKLIKLNIDFVLSTGFLKVSIYWTRFVNTDQTVVNRPMIEYFDQLIGPVN